MERATADLFPLAAPSPTRPWPTLASWLVLRQGGLRDDLHRRAAAAQVPGWFDPPVCLFAELATRWGADRFPPLSPEERVALLTAIVSRHAEGVFDRSGSADAWIPAIDRLHGELLGEGVTADAFSQAMSTRADRDDFERDRDARLSAIYADWIFALRQNFRSDGRDALVRLAQSIQRDPDTLLATLGGRRDVRIVGLADLRGGWRPLLSALAACPHLDRVTVFASHAMELPGATGAIVEPDDAPPALAHALFTASIPVSLGTLHLLEAPDAAREIEHVAVRVRRLLDEGTSEPARIAIVLRQARPGIDRMAEALDALGVPVTARRRTALAQTGPARAVRALLHAAAEGFTRHAVVEIAEHPMLSLRLDADVLQAAGQSAPIASLDAWEPALAQLHTRCVQRDATPADWRSHRSLPSTTRAERTLSAWRSWLPLARALTESRTDSEWFAWVHEVLEHDAWGVATQLHTAPGGDDRVWRAEAKAREQIMRVANEWTRALRELQVQESASDAESFARRLALVLDADVITQPETGFGVVVAEALSAGWRSFDHVFLVGLSSGEFPRRPPPSALLPERDRRSLIAGGLALDAPDAWRVREQELFRVLCAAPRASLTLSWPAMDGDGREVARSAYVDDVVDLALRVMQLPDEAALEQSGALMRVVTQQVLTPGFPSLARSEEPQAVADMIGHAQRIAAIERARSTELSPWNGSIENPVLASYLAERFAEPYNWSATQLEELAKCGWSWLASRVLKLEHRGDLDDGMEATTRGILLHDALDRFFEAARTTFGAPALLFAAHTERALAMMDSALEDAWTALAATTWLGNPALHDFVRAELRRQLRMYLEFEISRVEDTANNRKKPAKQVRMGALEGERVFENVSLEGDGVRFRLRGVIDRIDQGADDRLPDSARYIAAIDYKSSRYSTPAGGKAGGWTDGVVLQVPLYAKALETLYPEHTLARLEYRTLKKPESIHTLEFVKVATVGKGKSAAKVAIDVPDAVERLTEALSHAGQRVRQARAGTLPASPASSCGCSPYCVARDICRIPGGPVEAPR